MAMDQVDGSTPSVMVSTIFLTILQFASRIINAQFWCRRAYFSWQNYHDRQTNYLLTVGICFCAFIVIHVTVWSSFEATDCITQRMFFRKGQKEDVELNSPQFIPYIFLMFLLNGRSMMACGWCYGASMQWTWRPGFQLQEKNEATTGGQVT